MPAHLFEQSVTNFAVDSPWLELFASRATLAWDYVKSNGQTVGDRNEPGRGDCAWRTEGSGKSVAMAGSATLHADGKPFVPERSFSLRWTWRWRSVAGQVVELARLVAVARSDRLVDDPAPVAVNALARSRTVGWRGVLAAHEAAWQQRWEARRRYRG